MQLNIWTTADSNLLSKTFGASLKDFRPKVPYHQFIRWDEGADVPEPAAGEVTLVCGKKPLDSLRRAGIAAKNRTVTSLRETPIPRPSGGKFLVTFDPGLTQTEFDKKEVIDWDLRLAVRLMRTGSMLPEIGTYQWVNSFAQVIARVEEKFKKTNRAVDVSMDTETMGLHPWYGDRDLVSISFTVDAGQSHLLYLREANQPIALDPSVPLLAQVTWLLTSPKVRLRMANGKFDLIWIAEKWGLQCTNFKFDTMLVGTLLNDNRSNSLNLHAKIYTPLGGYDDYFNRTYDKGKMEMVPTADLLTYAGGDTDACQQVADIMRDELANDERLTRFYLTILHPASRAFEKIERRGILVDQDKYAVLDQDLRKVIKEGEKTSLSLLPQKMLTKYRDRIVEQQSDGKNPMLPSILKDYFFTCNGLNLKPREFTAKTGEPSMAKSHLRQFADNPDAAAMVKSLTDTDSASKTLSTFVVGFLKHLRPDGRFHPSYMLFHGGFQDDADDESGSVTGRLSAKEPAFQTLPKKTAWAKRIRECFIAPPGKVILSIDYSQGELKVIACVSPEPTMLASYDKGLDLHAVTGAKLAQVSIEEFLTWKGSEDKKLAERFDLLRGNAKPANFGLIYGMQVEGFRAYSWANYGIRLSFEEAEGMRNAFFELYPGLLGFHGKSKEFVKLHEHVRSPLGRVRNLPGIRSWDREVRSRAERQAINSPIQSCLTDMMLWAVALINEAYPNGEIEVVGTVHDALISYVPEGAVALWAGRAINIMSNLPLHEVNWSPQLKFTVDAEIGHNLANMKKPPLVV
jgi:DNA polymerase I-like protein with 3'-5' exonuclease and polymerase domains